jgi:hypothetical protein
MFLEDIMFGGTDNYGGFDYFDMLNDMELQNQDGLCELYEVDRPDEIEMDEDF